MRARLQQQAFFVTRPGPCPYLEGERERKVFTRLEGDDAAAVYDQLARLGFRRSHDIAYRPMCPACSACVPVRIDVARFVPNRSMRRAEKANAQLRTTVLAAKATDEQFELFARYLASRHAGGEMADMGEAQYRAMVEDGDLSGQMVEHRQSDGRLVACCLEDRLSDGLSAVYSFFAPEIADRSPGTWMILDLVRRAAAAGLPWAYLGYWVKGSPKMSYKTRFRPIEGLGATGWQELPA